MGKTNRFAGNSFEDSLWKVLFTDSLCGVHTVDYPERNANWCLSFSKFSLFWPIPRPEKSLNFFWMFIIDIALFKCFKQCFATEEYLGLHAVHDSVGNIGRFKFHQHVVFCMWRGLRRRKWSFSRWELVIEGDLLADISLTNFKWRWFSIFKNSSDGFRQMDLVESIIRDALNLVISLFLSLSYLISYNFGALI